MKQLIFFIVLFVWHGVFAQKVIFHDEFSDNAQAWQIFQESDAYSNVFNGNYILSVAKEGKKASIAKNIPVNLRTDFEITARLRQFEGKSSSATGLVWNYENANNFMAFLIDGESGYKVVQIENGQEKIIKNWTKSSDIFPQGRSNVLSVRITALSTLFYANEKLLYSTFSFSLKSSQIGFIVDGQASLGVDVLTVRQLEGELPVAFEENFETNENQWQTKSAEGEQAALVDGKFFIRRSFPTEYSAYANFLSLDYQKDFEIESHIRQLEGGTNTNFGLVWGAADAQNFNAFLVNAEGKFSLSQFKNSFATELKTGMIAQKPSINNNHHFKIKKNGKQISLYLDGNLLGSHELDNYFGLGIGFILQQNGSIAIDNLIIRQQNNVRLLLQNPPKIIFINPNKDGVVPHQEIMLQVGIQSESNVQKLSFYLNNRLMQEFEQPRPKNNYQAFAEHKLFLAEGSNTIKVVVQNQSGANHSQNLQIRYNPHANQLQPKLTWLSPNEENITVTEKNFHLKAGIISPTKITALSVSVNQDNENSRGFEVEEVQKQKEESYALVLERDIELKIGTNRIVVSIETESGLRLESIKNVVFQPETQSHADESSDLLPTRKDYALLFATDDYDEWTDLVNPINDAQTIANELKEFYGFEVEIVKNPTVEQLLSKLKAYAKKKYTPQDQLFIFVAGHGKFDEDFGEGYLVCKDSRKNDEGNASYITHSSLRTIANNIPAKHIFLTMDVCFGGTFDPKIAGHRGENDFNLANKADFIQRKLQFRTRKYLTSGGKEYVPDGKAGQHSPFARKFLEALRNYGGRDKILTTDEILSYLKDTQPNPRFGEFGTNDPGSDFLFIAK